MALNISTVLTRFVKDTFQILHTIDTSELYTSQITDILNPLLETTDIEIVISKMEEFKTLDFGNVNNNLTDAIFYSLNLISLANSETIKSVNDKIALLLSVAARHLIPSYQPKCIDNDNFIDDTGDTLLHRHVRNNDLQGVKTLLSQGVNPNISNYRGYTPIHIACENGFSDIVRLLLKFKADINIQCAVGLTPLTEIVRHGDEVLLKEIINKCSLLPSVLQPAVSMAVSENKPDMLEIFLDSGLVDANTPMDTIIESKMNDGSTLLHGACALGSLQMVNTLIDNYADVNARDRKGQTPLFKAILTHNYNLAVRLVNASADVNIRDITGATPLMYAVGGRNLQLIAFLLDHGADMYGYNQKQKTVFDLI